MQRRVDHLVKLQTPIRPQLVKILPFLDEELSILALEYCTDFPRRAQLLCNEMQGYDDNKDDDDNDDYNDDNDDDDDDDDDDDVKHLSMQSGGVVMDG